jgi:hypothetical protein
MLASDVAIVIVTRTGQDKLGVLQDWLGSKKRARAESIAKKSALSSKKLGFQSKLTNGDKTGTLKRQVQGQNGDSTGTKRGHLGIFERCFRVFFCPKIFISTWDGRKKTLASCCFARVF